MTSASHPDAAIHVVTAVYNRVAITRTFLNAMRQQNLKPASITIVDDASTDGTGEMLLHEFPEAITITTSGNCWWGLSIQKGLDDIMARLAGQDLSRHAVLIINDDVTIEPEFLDAACRLLANHDVEAACAMERIGKGKPQSQAYRFSPLTGRFLKTGTPDCFPTRGLLLRASLVAANTFHTPAMPHYLSDYDFTIRLSRQGCHIAEDKSFSLVPDPRHTAPRKLMAPNLAGRIRELFRNGAVLNPVPVCRFVWRYGNPVTRFLVIPYKFARALAQVL